MGDVQPWPSAGGRPDRPQGGGWQPAGQHPGYAAMRAAHTDRDRTVDVLKAAYAEGRLSADEYSARFDLANQAQTYGQLAQLVADLPSGPMPGPMPGPSAVPLGPPVPATFLPPTRQARNNGVAIASLVFGLLCVPSFGALGLPAVITGHMARQQIRRSEEGGDGMATFGLVVGYLSLAGWSLALFVAVLGALSHP
ncbi:hypothetical protein ABH930_003768 [Kitasatospora sp. GAS204A]|uniref:DUF1707 and DUF4190 domain-containing protein n=1 Tax=unclassified Kitasatospora TaxID=2633591 RepID=UPI00247EB7BF|nr:hypothetical protein [Kitasatospora sp. GAS204B]